MGESTPVVDDERGRTSGAWGVQADARMLLGPALPPSPPDNQRTGSEQTMKRFVLFALMAIAVVAFTGCATTYQATYQSGPTYYPYTEPWPDYDWWWSPGPYFYHEHVGRFHEHFGRDFDHDRDSDRGHGPAREHASNHEGHEHMGHGHSEVHESHHHG
jgi:hypothetical protein